MAVPASASAAQSTPATNPAESFLIINCSPFLGGCFARPESFSEPLRAA
jgi:hypothetical protein